MECMEHMDRIPKLSDINYSPLTEGVDSDFIHARADYVHGFPVARFKSVLNRTKIEPCGTASFIREVPEIV